MENFPIEYSKEKMNHFVEKLPTEIEKMVLSI